MHSLQSAIPSAAILAICNPPEGRLRREAARHGRCTTAGMIDLLLILSTAAFFGLSWGYARLCEKL
jgi:hypothetical protein